MATQVQGQRSPRWALWKTMLIPCRNGEDYLFRLRIVQTPWFGLYLHDIYHDDGDRDPHNHPWSFVSIVLRGHYTERVHTTPMTNLNNFVEKHHKRFSAHIMGRVAAHRIVDAAPNLKTLVICGRRASGWGFFKKEYPKYIPWQEYTEREEWLINHPGGIQES